MAVFLVFASYVQRICANWAFHRATIVPRETIVANAASNFIGIPQVVVRHLVQRRSERRDRCALGDTVNPWFPRAEDFRHFAHNVGNSVLNSVVVVCLFTKVVCNIANTDVRGELGRKRSAIREQLHGVLAAARCALLPYQQ